MKKTHLLFISIIVMIAMLAGCGRQAAPSAPAEVPEEVEGSASAEVSEAAEDTSAEAPAAEDSTLKVIEKWFG